MGDALEDFLRARLGVYDPDGQDSWERNMGFSKKEDEGYELGRCRVQHLTDKAIKVEVLEGVNAGMGAEGEPALWLPKSQIHSNSEINDTSLIDDEGTAWVSAWLAGQKNWR